MQRINPPLTSFRNATRWILALIFSLILNLLFLSGLPELIGKNSSKPDSAESFNRIDVIRVQRKEVPPRKKEIKKPEKEKPPKQKHLKARILQQKPVTQQPKLPFKLNPKLPAGPGSLPTFPLETAPMDFSGLDRAYGVGDLDGPLTPLAKVPPLYPMNARRRGVEGWVKVKFLVTETGFVEQIEILDSAPKNIFEQSVIRCVSSWRFKPGTIHGEPVNTWVTTTIRFELET